jgi:hypothetical protein
MPDAVALTRRQGLIAVALAGPVAVLAACSGDAQTSPTATAAGSLAPAPEDTTAAEEAVLVAAYDAALESLPGLPPETAAMLTLIRDQHAQHRDALGGSDAEPASVTAPRSLDEALGALLDAERAAARSRVRACVAATNAESARLLSLIAASEASHVPALRDLRA